jgi:hypothetical protein
MPAFLCASISSGVKKAGLRLQCKDIYQLTQYCNHLAPKLQMMSGICVDYHFATLSAGIHAHANDETI